VLTNEQLTLCGVCVAAPVGSSDHCQITVVVAVAPTAAAQFSTEGIDCKQVIYDWREADFKGMACHII